jgi:hypothetical protein
MGAVPKGYWRLVGNCPKSIRDLVSNFFRVADKFWGKAKTTVATQWAHFVRACYSYSYIIGTEFQLVRKCMFLNKYSIVMHIFLPCKVLHYYVIVIQRVHEERTPLYGRLQYKYSRLPLCRKSGIQPA